MNPIERKTMHRQIVKDINAILKNHGLNQEVSENCFTVNDKIITDGVKAKKCLSSLIIDNIWPSIPSADLYHYTNKVASESILSTNSLRLYSIEKRYKEDEIRAFCEKHSLHGYLDKDDSGKEKYKSLMSNIYYTSFADTNITPEHDKILWDRFACTDGARFKIKVTSSRADLRKMVYSDKPIPLLSELTVNLQKTYKKEFILSGISRLCAFNLPVTYGIESEVRMLHRYWCPPPEPKLDKELSFKYIEIPFGEPSEICYRVEIIEVQSNSSFYNPHQYKVAERS